MTYVMQAYDNLLEDILLHGEAREDRTGVGTLSRFGAQMRFDLRQGFPIATKKWVNFDAVVEELRWFLSGSTNIHDLDTKIWDAWARDDGDLGPIYGKQWRDWDAGVTNVDQIQQVIEAIKSDPYSRRHIVSAWNVGDLEKMALQPCHVLFQFYVSSDGYLDLQLYQRSGDMFLGVPFNIASYSILLSAIANITNLTPRYFIHSVGDAHIYSNHIEQVRTYLKQPRLEAPRLCLGNDILELLGDTAEALQKTGLQDYNFGPKLKAPVAL